MLELQTTGGGVSSDFTFNLQTLTYNIFDVKNFEYFLTHEQDGFHRHTMRFSMNGKIYEKQGITFEGRSFEFFNECIRTSFKTTKKIYHTVRKHYLSQSYIDSETFSFLDEEQVQILMNFRFNEPW